MKQWSLLSSLLGLLLIACVTTSSQEKLTLNRVRAAGLPVPREEIASSALAGGLNVLPGIGNMYLGAVSEEKVQWAFGFLNLLFWPLSIVWGVPEAAIDATTINEKYTAQYYMVGEGATQLDTAEQRKATPNPANPTPIF